MKTQNLRVQDITARIAGVSLRNTVKVLRALAVVSRAEGDDVLNREIRRIIVAGSKVDGEDAALDSRPGIVNVEACDESYRKVLANFDGRVEILEQTVGTARRENSY